MAVRDHVDEMLVGRIDQPRLVEARRLREAALHDHSVGIAAGAVAFGAEDVEPLAPAFDQRELIGGFSASTLPKSCSRETLPGGGL